MRSSLGMHHFSHLGAGFWTHISMHLTTSTSRNTLLAGAKVKALSQLHTHFLLGRGSPYAEVALEPRSIQLAPDFFQAPSDSPLLNCPYFWLCLRLFTVKKQTKMLSLLSPEEPARSHLWQICFCIPSSHAAGAPMCQHCAGGSCSLVPSSGLPCLTARILPPPPGSSCREH